VCFLYFIHNTRFQTRREYFKYIIQNLTNKHSIKNIDKPVYKDVTEFYNEIYSRLLDKSEDFIDVVGYKSTLDYLIIEIVTNIHTNIQLKFRNHLKYYLYAFFDLNAYFKNLKLQNYSVTEISKLKSSRYKEIQQILNTFFEDDKGFIIKHIPVFNVIFNEKNSLTPTELTDLKKSIQDTKDLNKSNDKKKNLNLPTTKKTVMYDIQVNPQHYLLSMIKMAQFYQEKHYKHLNVLPLRRTVIPSFIRLDTQTVIERFVLENKQQYRGAGMIEMYRFEIWNQLLRINKSIFKHN
jgi:hypothetical protein